jgi:iron(III) transport system substrate-binding protein
VASFGSLKADTMAVADVAKQRGKASQIVDKVGFDR